MIKNVNIFKKYKKGGREGISPPTYRNIKKYKMSFQIDMNKVLLLALYFFS